MAATDLHSLSYDTAEIGHNGTTALNEDSMGHANKTKESTIDILSWEKSVTNGSYLRCRPRAEETANNREESPNDSSVNC